MVHQAEQGLHIVCVLGRPHPAGTTAALARTLVSTDCMALCRAAALRAGTVGGAEHGWHALAAGGWETAAHLLSRASAMPSSRWNTSPVQQRQGIAGWGARQQSAELNHSSSPQCSRTGPQPPLLPTTLPLQEALNPGQQLRLTLAVPEGAVQRLNGRLALLHAGPLARAPHCTGVGTGRSGVCATTHAVDSACKRAYSAERVRGAAAWHAQSSRL